MGLTPTGCGDTCHSLAVFHPSWTKGSGVKGRLKPHTLPILCSEEFLGIIWWGGLPTALNHFLSSHRLALSWFLLLREKSVHVGVGVTPWLWSRCVSPCDMRGLMLLGDWEGLPSNLPLPLPSPIFSSSRLRFHCDIQQPWGSPCLGHSSTQTNVETRMAQSFPHTKSPGDVVWFKRYCGFGANSFMRTSELSADGLLIHTHIIANKLFMKPF